MYKLFKVKGNYKELLHTGDKRSCDDFVKFLDPLGRGWYLDIKGVKWFIEIERI